MPAFEPSDEATKDLYATFGLAVFLCQSIEANLAYSLLAYGKLTGELLTMEQYDQMESSLQRLTLGRVVSKVQEVAKLNDTAELVLSEALKMRNFLIHHYFRERAYDWFAEKTFAAMKDELNGYVEKLTIANSFATEIYSALAKACGVTDERVQQELRSCVGPSDPA